MSHGPTKVQLSFPDGSKREASAVEVSVLKTTEAWCTCELEDGSIVKIKPVVAKALRTDQFDSEDNPIYQILVGQIVFVEAAENLKRKKSE